MRDGPTAGRRAHNPEILVQLLISQPYYMYWKICDHIDDFGNHWVGYYYFDLIPIYREYTPAVWYNGIQKEYVYPVNYTFEIRAQMLLNTDDFEDWYKENKNL